MMAAVVCLPGSGTFLCPSRRQIARAAVGGCKGVYQDESDVAIERVAGAYGRRLDVVPAFTSVYPIL
jgi:hypothetical protein